MQRSTRIFSFVALDSYFLLLNPNLGIFAAETPKLSILPAHFTEEDPRSRSWLIYNVEALQNLSDEVVVWNKGTSGLTLEIYAVDASANADGAFTLFPKGTRQDAGGWINLSQSRVTVNANQKVTLPFTIAIPALASPGDHVAGIAVEPLERAELTTSGVKVVQRVGLRAYFKVKGEKIESLEIKDLKVINKMGENYLVWTASNTGNTNLNLTGKVELRSILGPYWLEAENLGEVLAGKTVTKEVKLALLKPLSYLIGLNVAYAPNKSTSRYTVLKSTQFGFALMTGLGLLVLTAVIMRKLKNK